MIYHARVHVDKKPYSCKTCGKGFPLKSHLKCNQKLHDTEKSIVCNVCGKTFMSKARLIVHIKIHEPYLKKKFSKGSSSEETVKAQESIGHESKPLSNQVSDNHSKAEDNGSESSNLAKLVENIKEEPVIDGDREDFVDRNDNCKQEVKEEVLEDVEVSEEDGDVEPAYAHKKKRRKLIDKKCSFCAKEFTTKQKLTVHMRIHTGEKPFSCKNCKKCFTHKGTLTEHERTHTGEKPYSCVVCEKTFSVKSNLTVHERVHTGEKPYSCELCGKSFTLKSHMIYHERLHTGERPFACQICGKSFPMSSQLKCHERLHSDENPFGCLTCRKFFTSIARLTIHKRIHTGEKPFPCNVCGKAFSLKGTVNRHKLKVHGIKDDFKDILVDLVDCSDKVKEEDMETDSEIKEETKEVIDSNYSCD